MTSRKQIELEQGRAIAAQAEEIWGWGTPAGRLRAQRRASLIIIGADIGPGQDVLEIGCGTGVFTEHFAETGANITALDLSPDLLDQAKVRVNGVQFRLGDAECLPFEAESFDAVVGSSILHHVNLQIVLDEIW